MIGIFGGTFDPVHYGHLRPALEVQQVLGLQEVRFIPAGLPPHRDTPHASAAQRVEMLRLAIASQAGFVLDEREIQRPGPSYMVDTLHSLREELGNIPLCLILGFDAFLGLTGWHQWKHLIELTHLIVTHRPGWSQQAYQQDEALHCLVSEHQCSAAQLVCQPAGGLLFIPVTQLEISATRIREQIGSQQDVRYLLPDAVIQKIKQQDIYR